MNGLGQEGQYDTFQQALAHCILISLFFDIPIFITNGLFEQKPWKLMLINCGYWMVTLALMGGVLGVVNHFSAS